MPDVFTTTGSVDYDTAAYELLMRYAYRPELYYDAWTDVRSTNTTHRGSSVRFFIQSDLAVATTPLTEDVDVSAVPLANTFVDVTMLEYGNATVTTARLNASSMFDIDAAAANVVGFNAGISMDTIARTPFYAGTNVSYATGSGSVITTRATVAAANTLRAADFRRQYANLRRNNVPTVGGMYVAIIHPDVAYDLKSETGDLGWRAPHVYSDPQAIYNGEIGAFEGFRVIVTPRAPFLVDAGATNTDVYQSVFLGQEAVAKGYSTGGGYGPDPVVVMGPVVDKLRRFQPVGWKHFVGYSVFRQAAIWRVESSSSIGNNGVG